MRRFITGVSALWLLNFGVVISVGLYGQAATRTPPPRTSTPTLVATEVNVAGRASFSPIFDQENNRSWEIFLENTATNQLRRLTDNFTSDRFPVLSPNQQQVAFVSWRDGNPEIYVIDLNTGKLQNISNNPQSDLLPVWSPDSTMLAFVSQLNGNAEIYLADLQSGLVHNLTHSPDHDTSPKWSPDGSYLVYWSYGINGKQTMWLPWSPLIP